MGELITMTKLIIAMFLCMSFNACSKPTESAKGLLTKLYTRYEKSFLEIDIRSKYVDSLLTPAFSRLIRLDANRSVGEMGYLNWDPLCDCQDPEGIHLDSISVLQKSDTAFCEVRLKYLGVVKTIRYEFVEINKKLLIRDIGSKAVPSLFDYLLENLKKDYPDSVGNSWPK